MVHDAAFGQISVRFGQGRLVRRGEGLVIHRGIAQGPEGGRVLKMLQEPQSYWELVFWQGIDQRVEAFSFVHGNL